MLEKLQEMPFLAQEWKLQKNQHYTLGNATEQLQGIASNLSDNVLDVAINVKEVADKVSANNVQPVANRAVELVGGGEAGQSLGKIALKTTKDIARGDKVCDGEAC